MSAMPVVKFNRYDRHEFYQELRKRVAEYFIDKNISKHANLNMKLKSAFMFGLYFIPLGFMITGFMSNFYLILVMWALMGLGMSGIGLSIMHDANHGSYSKHKIVNQILGFSLNFLGAYHINWKIQHNVLHHSFTNIHEFDEDLEKGVMRFSPNQERKGYFKYQIFYAPILYGLMTIFWLIAKDFQLLFRYHKKELLAPQGLTFQKALFQILLYKSSYVLVILIIPILVIPVPWWQVFVGFLMMHYISGMILALVFQPAHITQDTSFYKVDETGSVENNWAIHQMYTTSNYSHGAKLFSWFIGGINYQIEHHLFPGICHIHYSDISEIVKKTAAEYGIPYYQHRTFIGALKSHFILIDQLGRGVELR